jgi:hypothetical protein
LASASASAIASPPPGSSSVLPSLP